MLRRLRNRTPLNPILSPTIIEEFESLRLRFSEDIDKVAALVGGNGGMEISPLPQSVYDDIANPAITSVSVPRGRYKLSGDTLDFYISRSNLDLDFNGSTIVLPPLFGYPFYVFSVVDKFVDPLAQWRNASHLTGAITAGTTQLTMDDDERMDVTPGEVVTIVAGTHIFDPVEPAKYIVAEVLSVSGQVITFTAPLGENIPVYASEAALKAVVAPGLWFKIGPWGGDFNGNYTKGLGTDHGLLRYVGGMTHDTTFRNFHLEMTVPSDAALTVGKHPFFFTDVLRPKVLNWSTTNCIGGSLVHTWRCNDVMVDGLTVRGEGRSKIFEPDQSLVSNIFTAWGGKNITYKNVSVHGKNINCAGTEVSPENVLLQNWDYEVEFDGSWSYNGEGCPFNFSGSTLGFGARMEHSVFNITGLISDWNLDPGNVLTFKDCAFSQATFGNGFPFGRHIIEGTITVGGVAYGPLVSDTKTLVRTGGVNGKRITFPKGFYKSARFRCTTQGSCNDLADGFGNYHTAELSSGAWKQLTQGYWIDAPPTSIAAYLAQRWFSFNWSGSSSCTCEFEIEYYPAPDNPGWVMD